ncbi:MAG TPA: c-type cytochrome domain-containing protein, partial [Chthoniobacteraceae bacterium]|nr:c-type cytochrome domain-containing protein [Chthoniobacteraceae bacterium]
TFLSQRRADPTRHALSNRHVLEVFAAGRRKQHASRVRSPEFCIRALVGIASFCVLALSASAADKVTYVNDVLPILRNSCLNCHNPDKDKAGLDMTTYQGIMAGSDTRKVITPGDSANSILFKCVNHEMTPTMPPKSDKIPDAQIDIIKKWIDGHALETADSQVVIAKNTAPALELFSQEKADGPPPMPQDLLLEPEVKTPRAGSVVSMAASPRAPIVAVAGQKQVLLYNTDTMDLAGVLPYPEGFPQVVKFSRDGRLVIAGGGIGAKSGRVVVWDVTTGQRVMEVGDEYDAVLAVDMSADHHLIALGGPNRLVKIFKDGKLLFNIKKHTDWITALAFTSDGKMLVSGDRQGGLEVWETSSGTELFLLTSLKGAVTAITAPGPQSAITAGDDGTVKFWDLREGKELKTWQAHPGGTLSVSYAPDGRLVTSGRDKIVRLWSKDGAKLKEFEPFSDVALCSAISGDKVVAGDWTGTIREWSAADGKRLAEWNPNPPPIADRLTATEAKIAALQQAHDKTAALLADAEKAAKQSGAEASAAAQAAADKEKAAKTLADQAAALAKNSADADALAKKTAADLAKLQAETQALNTDLAHAVAMNDSALQDEKTGQGNMQEKQAALAQLADACKTAQAQADSHPGDQSLADAAAKAKADLDKATDEFAADQKSAAAAEAAAQHAKEALAKANEAAAANKDSIDATQSKLKDQSTAADKLRASLADAQKALDAAKADSDAMAKSLPPKVAQARDADEKLAKITHDAQQIDHDLAAAKADEFKWKAAQVNITLFAAKKQLADAKAAREIAIDAAHQASAELDKANADIAAAEKALADSPQTIKSKQDAITAAQHSLDAANTATAAAKETAAHKESLIAPAAAQSDALRDEALDSPYDDDLTDAALSAQSSLGALNKALASSKQDAAARAADVTKAIENLTAAQKALEQAKADAANAPAAIAKLRTTAAEVAKRTALARAAADKAVAEASKPVEAAQAKVDSITRDYQALLHQSETANPPVAALTKK